MATSTTHPLPSCTTFGELLHYLRRRARLTQRELSIAVGYSESMISRLEHNERPPDLTTLLAVFVPALDVAHEPEIVAQLTTLARAARSEAPAASKQVEAPTVTSAPPSLSARVRLPQRLTSFIGREAEIVAMKRLLAQARLVTLTGPGGCGKTSLAVEIGRAMADTSGFKDGIYLVELAPLTDPALLAQSILLALGIEGNRERAAAETLLSFVGNKQALLVLDNCEHLIDTTARLVEGLLRACPNLRVLVTSRERLNIPGEILYAVLALAFPNPQLLPDLAALPRFAAIQLFVERSQMVVSDFQLTAQNAAAVAQICARLDGIPLALELASAALLTFSVHEVAKRLESRFLLSTPGYRTVDVRHQSLNDTVAWSYNLLAPAEQRLLASLAVFVGGWTAEALQAICQDEVDCLALLRQLVQKSLVRVEQGEAAEVHTRYHLLRAIREYATERLGEQAEAEVIRRRHFVYFVQLATELGAAVLGPQQRQSMTGLDADYHNISAAFFYANGKADLIDDRARLAAALPYYWFLRGNVATGVSWLQATLTEESRLSLSTRALAYVALLTLNYGNFYHRTMDVGDLNAEGQLLALAEPLIEPCLRQGDEQTAAQLILSVGHVYNYHGNLLKANAFAQRAWHLFETLGDQRGMGFTRNLLIWITLAQGDIQMSQTMQAENMHFLQQNGTIWGLSEAYDIQIKLTRLNHNREAEIYNLKQLVTLAEQEDSLHFIHGVYYDLEHVDAASAIQLAELFLERQRQKEVGVLLGLALHQLGRMYLNSQQFERAQTLLEEELTFWRRLGEDHGHGVGLQWTLIDRGQVARFLGDLDLAIACFDQSIALFALSPYSIGAVFPRLSRGIVRLIKHDLNGALDDFCQSLDQAINAPKAEPKDWEKFLIRSCAGIGEVARQRGDLALAARLFAAAAVAAQDAKGQPYCLNGLFSEVTDHNRIMAAMPTYRRDPIFAAAWQEGEKLSLGEAIMLALAG